MSDIVLKLCFVTHVLQMPCLDGLEAIKRQRAFELRSGITASHQFIIALSANSDSLTIDKALAAGADMFLPKPFTLHAFTQALNNYRAQQNK